MNRSFGMQEVDGNLQGREEGSSVVRLHVGGLGPAVISSDLRQTFSSLVHVSSVDVVRSKGRNFAYLTIQAAPHDLKRLFSLYNGCMWKGGCLKLEKAREFYMDKLQREWAERDCPQDLIKSKPDTTIEARIDPKLKTSSGLNIYFPRLRKVKKIPEKGLGKHKRSFERVEPLPHSLLQLCNCEEECMAACSYQSLAEKKLLGTDREEMRQQSVTNKTSLNDAMFKILPTYQEPGKKGNKVFEGRGWDARGSDKVLELDDLRINMKEGMPKAEIDDVKGADSFDEPILNITGSKFVFGQDEDSEDHVSEKEGAQKAVDAIHAQRKRQKVEHDLFSKKKDRQHSEIDKGTNQILHGEELTGSKFSRSAVGRNWVQKASWKSLVGGTGQMPFSLGSFLKQTCKEGVEEQGEAYQ